MNNISRVALILASIVIAMFPALAKSNGEPQIIRNIPYVDKAAPDQTMDLFWTKGRPTATVLFIHGGSLKETGERRSSPPYRDVCNPFVNAGIACASMDYRLSPSYRWPSMPNDVAAAFATLRKLVADRGGDPNRMFLFGHSSGCHLAAIMGTNSVYLQTAGLAPSNIAGVIAMGCTLDRKDFALRRVTADEIRESFLRDSADVSIYGTPEALLSANPASYVGAHAPPTLVVVARGERFMPPILEQGSRFVRRLLEQHVPADLVIVPGEHMTSIAQIGLTGDPTFRVIKTFIDNPKAAGQVSEAAPGSQSSAGNFELQKVAEGVYAAIRKEPPGLMFNSNSVFIINDDDVVVVDTNITPSSAKEVLAALRKLTNKPVKYVVNTHWHPDHISGNQVYRDAFPGVEFIAQETTLKDLPAVGESNRKDLLTNGPAFAVRLRSLVEKKKSLGGWDLTDEERVGYLSDASQIEELVKEAPEIQIILPTLTIEDHLTLHRGSRTIDIRYLGRAHTRADLVVYLPKEGVVITGDIVVWPVPLVGSTSYPLDYAATLGKLLALHATVIVPGHGPVLHDDSYIKLMVRLLTSIKQQVEAAVARGETLEQMRKNVNLDEFRKAFAGDSRFRQIIFDTYVTDSAVAAAYAQASARSRIEQPGEARSPGRRVSA